MPVDVHGMCIVGTIAKENSVFGSWPKHEFVLVRKLLAVDGPVVESMDAPRDFLEDHVNGFGRRRRRRGPAENRVIPNAVGGPQKLRLALLVLVLDDDAQAGIAISIGCGAQSPDAGPVHIHETIDSLPRSHENN